MHALKKRKQGTGGFNGQERTLQGHEKILQLLPLQKSNSWNIYPFRIWMIEFEKDEESKVVDFKTSTAPILIPNDIIVGQKNS